MRVSVIISTYNGEKYIHECLDSIQNQTLSDFEVIIVDDMSKDNTISIANEYRKKDERFHIYKNNIHNHSETLNLGLKHARGKYVARIDQDDIMEKERLEIQSEFMDANKFISVCGSWIKYFGIKNGCWDKFSGEINQPLFTLLLGTPLFNPSTMIRRSFLDKNKIYYNKEYSYAEDFKIWSDIAKLNGRFYVIPYYLTQYRISSEQASSKHYEEQYTEALSIKNNLLNHIIEKNIFPENDKIKKIFKLLNDYNNDGFIKPEIIFQLAYDILMSNKISI